MLRIEPDGAAELDPCPDCGERTQSIWGYVWQDDQAHAVYFVRWTNGPGPGFMVRDSAALSWNPGEIVGEVLSREVALASPITKQAFAIVDEILVHEPRFRIFLAG